MKKNFTLPRSLRKALTLILAALSVALLVCAPVSALSSRTELLNTVTLTGNIRLDICNTAKANIGNSNYASKIGENYCEDFVSDVCHLAGAGSAVPTDNGSVNGFYSALMKCGAKVVTAPKFGDIIIYVNVNNNDKCHAALYTKNSGVNKDGNDSIQGNLGGVIKEAKLNNYLTTVNGKTLTVGNGLKVIYVRPNYKDNRTVANALNSFNRNKTCQKNGDYILNDSGTTFYYAPCASSEKFTLGSTAFKKGDKLCVDGYYNGFVRIVQIRNEGYNTVGVERTRAYGVYVRFTDLALQSFNFNKLPVTALYQITKSAPARSAPCQEGSVKRTLKAGTCVRIVASGENHVKGHIWGLTSEGEYVYLSTNALKKLTLGKASVSSFKETCVALNPTRKQLSLTFKAASNADIYKVEFIDAKTGKVVRREEKKAFSFNWDKPTKNSKYFVRVYAGRKLCNGKVFYDGTYTQTATVVFTNKYSIL